MRIPRMTPIELLENKRYAVQITVFAEDITAAQDEIDRLVIDEIDTNSTLVGLGCMSVEPSAAPRVIVMSKWDIDHMFNKKSPPEGSESIAIISISSAIETPAEINTKGPIIRFVFDDVDKYTGSVSCKEMTDEQAYKMAQFMKGITNDEKIEILICQCAAGISRSAGAAAAYCEWSKNHNSSYIFNDASHIPNMLVYHKVYKSLMEE